MSADTVLGLDFGATKLALGVVDASGRVVEHGTVPSRVTEGAEAICAGLIEAAVDVLARYPAVDRIGLGFKGPLDTRRGLSLELPGVGGRVADWENVPVARLIETAARDRLGRTVRVWLENDVTVAALGELWQGVARGASNWVFVICGTGIGVKVFEAGRLVRGQGAAGEFGHTIIDPTQREWRCGCGSDLGHLEALASGQSLDRRASLVAGADPDGAVARLAAAAGEVPSGVHLVQAAAGGDPAALAQVEAVQRYLGWGLANLVNLVNPELIVVGGGAATGNCGFVLGAARRIALAAALPALAADVRIEASALGGEAGVVGAAYLALHEGAI